ncbi:MAG: DUF2807 domain-containing protein [Candidatus Aminicenantaceae bacterium]
MKWTHLVSKKWFFILMGIALVFTCSCRNSFYDDDSVYGSGVVVEEIREVDSFHSVEILGSCDLYFVKGATQELRVITDDNILPLILTWVRYDGTLIIESKGSYTSSVGIKVYVSMVEIRRFAISGSGECRIHVEDVLNVVIAGSGNVYYKGFPSVVNTTIIGSGDVIHLG